MSAPIFLGVDCGGTKTSFLALRGDGRVLASHREGSGYHLQIGLDGLRAMLARGTNIVLAKATIAATDLGAAFFGLAAFGEDSRIERELSAIPREVLPGKRVFCGNDMVSGFAGALAGEDGINLTAGTGSIGYGERGGKSARAGGWGEIFSDEGSAYWIAVRGLNAFSRMSDGRLAKGPLHARFRDAFGIDKDLDLSGRIMASPARDEIAKSASIVTAAAREGDGAAITIFADAARELALIACAVDAALGPIPGEEVKISWSGGVFSAGPLILEPLQVALTKRDSRFTLVVPRFSPEVGAALAAARAIGATVDTAMIDESALQRSPPF